MLLFGSNSRGKCYRTKVESGTIVARRPLVLIAIKRFTEYNTVTITPQVWMKDGRRFGGKYL
jgi:hypothetical protein